MQLLLNILIFYKLFFRHFCKICYYFKSEYFASFFLLLSISLEKCAIMLAVCNSLGFFFWWISCHKYINISFISITPCSCSLIGSALAFIKNFTQTRLPDTDRILSLTEYYISDICCYHPVPSVYSFCYYFIIEYAYTYLNTFTKKHPKTWCMLKKKKTYRWGTLFSGRLEQFWVSSWSQEVFSNVNDSMILILHFHF